MSALHSLTNTTISPQALRMTVIQLLHRPWSVNKVIDVYEEEDKLFFTDHSDTIIQDATLQLLQSFPNVMITAHQEFFTKNALTTIAETTLTNIAEFEHNKPLSHEVIFQTVS